MAKQTLCLIMAFISTTSKARKVSIFVFILLVTVATLFIFTETILARYSTPYTIEWAGEASSIQLQRDKSNPYSGRLFFISHTPFGDRMVREYIATYQARYPELPIERNRLFSSMVIDQHTSTTYRLLSYAAFVNLELKHYWHLLRSKYSTHNALVSASPASTVYFEPLFTRGLHDQPDNTLINRLRFLIQNAAPGSNICFSVFLFFYENPNEPLLLDILAAAERGINIQLISDLPEAENPANRGIGKVFQDAFKVRLQEAAAKGHSNSWIKEHADAPWDSKNHTKIFLFSDSGGQKYWTIFTSENLTDREREKHQAGIVIRDKQIYDDFKTYTDQILQGSYKDLWVSTNQTNLSHYFFPQTTGEDIIYDQLDRINLEGATQGTLKISMARWNFERFPLAMKLVQLAELGVQIEIITRNNPNIVDTQILDVLSHRPNITLHTADVARLNIHSKYVLFEGRYKDDEGRDDNENNTMKKILWTGSHNFTGMATRNNYETWSEIRDDKIFQNFSDNFTELKSLVPADLSSGNLKQ